MYTCPLIHKILKKKAGIALGRMKMLLNLPPTSAFDFIGRRVLIDKDDFLRG